MLLHVSSRVLETLTAARIVIDLTPHTHRLFQLGVILIQAACIAYLVCMGKIYFFLDSPYMEYYANLLAPTSSRHLTFFGSMFFVLAGLHGLHIAWIINDEIRLFVWIQRRCRQASSPSTAVHSLDRSFEKVKRSRIYSNQLLQTTAQTLFSREGIFGVESPYFWTIFFVREVVEIGAQGYQVYRSSRLIARSWINDISITILVINCWSTPLWQHIFRQNTAMERIVCVVNDGLLNIGTSIILPLIVFLPYARVFDTEQYSFPLNMLYGDVEFINLVVENQSVFATSMVDGFTKIVSHFAILTSFPAMRSLVRRVRPSDSRTAAPPSKLLLVATPVKPTSSIACRLLHLLFLVGGVTVLSIHLHARHLSSGSSANEACLQTMQPWLASKHPCAIYRVDCQARNVSSPPSDALDKLDNNVLLNLYFMNCPQLQVPTSIQRFPNLIGVEVHNSTITQWSIDAAIHSDHHPRMMYLIMVRVNMTSLPNGVLQPLPPLLTDIELIHTNLTALPADLDERWPNMALFFVEYGQFHEFPPVLLRMPIFELSLVGNHIQELPPLRAEYSIFSMARNPLKSVADSVDDAVHMGYFSLQDTQVETLPVWIGTQVDVVVYLMATPFCRALEDGDVEVEQWRGDNVIGCDKPDPRGSGRYPLELVDAMRSKQTS